MDRCEVEGCCYGSQTTPPSCRQAWAGDPSAHRDYLAKCRLRRGQEARSVELTDSVRAGFMDAMDRVKELGLKANETLVNGISREAWTSWDASHEMAIVIDTDGPDSIDCEDDLMPAPYAPEKYLRLGRYRRPHEVVAKAPRS